MHYVKFTGDCVVSIYESVLWGPLEVLIRILGGCYARKESWCYYLDINLLWHNLDFLAEVKVHMNFRDSEALMKLLVSF